MYRFIEENFNPQKKFIERTSKSATLKWSLKSGKILSVLSADEFPELFPDPVKDYQNENHFIYEIIPKKTYNKIWKQAYVFFRKHVNGNKNYIVNFVLNGSNINNALSNNYIIFAHIISGNEMASLIVSHAGAIKNLNDKIITISELVNGDVAQLVYTASMQSGSRIKLIKAEYEILRLMAMGYNTDTIADLMHLSKHTIDNYRKILNNKFKAQNIFQLISHAHKEGFI